MNKNRFLYIFLICNFFALKLPAQIKIGISVNPMLDRNWNVPLKDIRQTLPYDMNLQSLFPVAYGLHTEYIISSKYNIGSGINFVQRNISVQEDYVTTRNFSHQTIEIPLLITYKKSLSNDITLIAIGGGSVDFVTSRSEKMGSGYIGWSQHYGDSTYFEFSWHIIRPPKVTPSVVTGIGLENNFGKYGSLQLGFAIHYQMQKQVKFFGYSYIKTKQAEAILQQTSSTIDASYAILSLKYFLPLFNHEAKKSP